MNYYMFKYELVNLGVSAVYAVQADDYKSACNKFFVDTFDGTLLTTNDINIVYVAEI